MLDELLQVLEKRDTDTERVNFALKDVEFVHTEDGPQISFGSTDKYAVEASSFTDVCSLLDIPKSYASRCPKSEQERMINFWFKHRGSALYSALVESGNLRAFLDPSYPYVSTARIVEAEINAANSDLEVGNFNLTSNVLEYIAFTPEFNQDVIDSPVRGGLRTVHSDSWSVFPRFDSYVYRVVCTNGMISPLAHKKFRVSGKSENEIIDQVEDFVKISMEQLPVMFEGFLRLEEMKVDNFVSVITRICMENKIPKKIRELLIESASSYHFKETIRGNINSMYDLMNLISYVASHDEEMTDANRELLFAISGNLLLHQSSRCVTCGGAIE